jgi:hypothetical protein
LYVPRINEGSGRKVDLQVLETRKGLFEDPFEASNVGSVAEEF